MIKVSRAFTSAAFRSRGRLPVDESISLAGWPANCQASHQTNPGKIRRISVFECCWSAKENTSRRRIFLGISIPKRTAGQRNSSNASVRHVSRTLCLGTIFALLILLWRYTRDRLISTESQKKNKRLAENSPFISRFCTLGAVSRSITNTRPVFSLFPRPFPSETFFDVSKPWLKVQRPYVPRNNRVSERWPTSSTEFPIRSRASRSNA